MGMLDPASSNRFWKFSFYSKENALQVPSSRKSEKNYFVTNGRKSHLEEGAIHEVSLRATAHLFYLRARGVAARFQQMRLQPLKGLAEKLPPLDNRSCLKFHPPSPTSFQISERLASSSASKGLSLWFSRSLFARKKRKGSLFVCGAGMGAFSLFLLRHAGAHAFDLPGLALNAGLRLVCFLVQVAHKKCDDAGSNGAACFMRGFRRAFSLFRMFLSLLRSTFVVNPFLMTSLLAVLIGAIVLVRQFERNSRQSNR